MRKLGEISAVVLLYGGTASFLAVVASSAFAVEFVGYALVSMVAIVLLAGGAMVASGYGVEEGDL
jgi:cytochrome c oxidase assembly factor CtaG